jgi:hypothetical protein
MSEQKAEELRRVILALDWKPETYAATRAAFEILHYCFVLLDDALCAAFAFNRKARGKWQE